MLHIIPTLFLCFLLICYPYIPTSCYIFNDSHFYSYHNSTKVKALKGGQRSLINRLHMYDHKNLREWSYQMQSAWSHFSSIFPKHSPKMAKHSTSSVVHQLNSTVNACWKTLTHSLTHSFPHSPLTHSLTPSLLPSLIPSHSLPPSLTQQKLHRPSMVSCHLSCSKAFLGLLLTTYPHWKCMCVCCMCMCMCIHMNYVWVVHVRCMHIYVCVCVCCMCVYIWCVFVCDGRMK